MSAKSLAIALTTIKAFNKALPNEEAKLRDLLAELTGK